MILILDGVDRCGKSTQAAKLQPLLIDKSIHFLHYSAIKGFTNTNDVKEYSKKLYRNMFSLLETNYINNHFILDRSHISEVVYSPLYRNYDGSYVYDLEKLYTGTEFWNQIYLITFIDEAESIVKRDDGKSFTIDIDKKNNEINAFIDATSKSNIINKKIINIANKNIDMVHKEIKTFIQNILV